MTTAALPVWRSLLFVPVTAKRFVDGAARRGADAIILDLEDSVAASEKERARTLVPEAAEIVSRGGADVVVRVNRPLRLAVRDIEVNMSGGYDPTQTDPDSRLIQTQLATYRELGADPLLWPRLGGSWPGCVFTNAPLSLPAGHFGMGHGTGAHAPDEYYLIESTNPKVQGLDGAVASFVEYLYALG